MKKTRELSQYSQSHGSKRRYVSRRACSIPFSGARHPAPDRDILVIFHRVLAVMVLNRSASREEVGYKSSKVRGVRLL